MAAPGTDLYRAKVTVTGQGEANRMVGFAACLEDVSSRYPVHRNSVVTGDWPPTNRRQKISSRHSAIAISSSGKPIRDEQGTRDRPYDLTVEFEEGKIDDILKAFGLKPWLSHRPRLAVFVEMEQAARSYIVTADGIQSDLAT